MPKFQINTSRLIIKSIQLSDAEAILNYRSDPIANKYQGWVPHNLEDVNDFIQNRVELEINIPETWHQLVIIHKESEKIIGDIGLHFMDHEEKQVEIGFTLDKNYQGKGYATEALKHLINYLFNNLNKHRILASIDPKNISSIKLVERLGFRKEAHFVKSLFINGKWLDDLKYAILEEEWKD